MKIHGCFDNFSCFKFENYLQYIKKSIESAKYPFQEITNRIMEKQKNFISSNLILDPVVIVKEIINRTFFPYFCLADKLFEKIILQELKITINIHNERDKYIMLKNNNIAIVNHIIQLNNELSFKLVVQSFSNFSPFFSEPILSSNIGLFIINSSILSDNFTISISDVKCKCFFIPLSNEKAIISTLNHSFNEKPN